MIKYCYFIDMNIIKYLFFDTKVFPRYHQYVLHMRLFYNIIQ